MWLRLLRSYGYRTGHAVIRFPLLDLLAQRLKRLLDGTVFIDAVDGEKETHCVCAAAIVQGVLQLIAAISASSMLRRIFPRLLSRNAL